MIAGEYITTLVDWLRDMAVSLEDEYNSDEDIEGLLTNLCVGADAALDDFLDTDGEYDQFEAPWE